MPRKPIALHSVAVGQNPFPIGTSVTSRCLNAVTFLSMHIASIIKIKKHGSGDYVSSYLYYHGEPQTL